ncbi:hypothetical protein CKO44_11475 [Rubrivivax gelatinosus]|uniref:HEAT repeat domain-containing protein n=1 Tax=Rubrivivax gelatinosus TaxID=28068 RepID=A0ABS1E0Z5_RUBGE|nr:hypothetical protein [Rubrivivax gelatinosus]MBK1715081.1 hypothetical protein [Rubrivivax gelatinosus]
MHASLQVGKYLVSPLTRLEDCGRFAASVSIRSGRGSNTHDRVLRLVPVFESRDDAVRYATAQGLAWIAGGPAVAHPATNQE